MLGQFLSVESSNTAPQIQEHERGSMNFGRSALRISIAFLFVVLGAVGLLAQTSTTGKVVGTVSDATGAVVPKAEVELLNTATNVAQNAITDDTGSYQFVNVIPGA